MIRLPSFGGPEQGSDSGSEEIVRGVDFILICAERADRFSEHFSVYPLMILCARTKQPSARTPSVIIGINFPIGLGAHTQNTPRYAANSPERSTLHYERSNLGVAPTA